MAEFTLASPLRVFQTKKRDFILNMNVYRVSHYRTLNKVKITYKKVMTDVIGLLPELKKIEVTYTVFPKTRRLCDVSNVCSVHSKFFLDALVELGKLPDDNYKYVPREIFQIGEVDPENPRVEITIKEI